MKQFLVKNFPALGKYKRFMVALKDSMTGVQKTYSQHAEDIFIWDTLQKYDLKGSVYVDIGANHPTDISNTYLLYRKGLNGIIIEPNEELVNLFGRYRQRDIALMIGCSNISSVLKFNISKTPVVSSFSNDRDVDVYKTVYLPVMPADAALSAFEFDYINFLSIDVEGLNFEVLEGAAQIVKKSLLVCLEFDSNDEIEKFKSIMGPGFEHINTVNCNIIFLNKALSAEKLKR